MTDREIEELLRRHRPVAPALDLRARILGQVRIEPVTTRLWWQLAAAAALLAAVTALRSATDRTEQRIIAETATIRPAGQPQIDRLAQWLAEYSNEPFPAEAAIVVASADMIEPLLESEREP